MKLSNLSSRALNLSSVVIAPAPWVNVGLCYHRATDPIPP